MISLTATSSFGTLGDMSKEIILAGVRKGGDRQDLHERVRQHALAARERLDDGADDNDFFIRISGDESFGLKMKDLVDMANPNRLVGRCAQQVEHFLRERVGPVLEETENLRAAEEVRV